MLLREVIPPWTTTVLRGLPRSPRELGKSLVVLATLRAIGWQRSSADRQPVNADGNPLPWFSYPAIRWLEGRLDRIASVLEFGACGSTIWFAEHRIWVASLEHDRRWLADVEARTTAALPRPQLVAVSPSEEGYAHGVAGLGNVTFDLVVVDGIHRRSCAAIARDQVGEHGLVCLDDSQRPEYADIVASLHDAGFTSIGFHGLSPIVGEEKETRFFSRHLANWMDTSQ